MTKNYFFFFFIQLRWARCDLYYIFTVTGRFWPKKTREWEGMGVILPGVEQFFRRIGTALDFFFCGRGTGKIWKSTPESPFTLVKSSWALLSFRYMCGHIAGRDVVSHRTTVLHKYRYTTRSKNSINLYTTDLLSALTIHMLYVKVVTYT